MMANFQNSILLPHKFDAGQNLRVIVFTPVCNCFHFIDVLVYWYQLNQLKISEMYCILSLLDGLSDGNIFQVVWIQKCCNHHLFPFYYQDNHGEGFSVGYLFLMACLRDGNNVLFGNASNFSLRAAIT